MTKPENFPARKQARKVSAAERRIPQLKVKLGGTIKPDNHKELRDELASLQINYATLISPQRDIRTKKRRAGHTF